MASSFASQIPTIVHLLSALHPRSVLDIGKGFGKYGFLLHEYCGIDNTVRPRPSVSLRDQSRIVIDAVESNPDYSWPHLEQFYRHIYSGRIESLYKELPPYDLVLMADVIEHLEKVPALDIVRHFIAAGSAMIIATPRDFFQQDLYQSADERHVSHWTAADFRPIANVDYQTVDGGRVFLVSSRPFDIRGFGREPVKRLRRMARALVNEI